MRRLLRRGHDLPTRKFCGALIREADRKETHMLHYAAIFFVIALVAAFFGFGGIAAGAAGIAKVLFVVFLVLAIVSVLGGLFRKA
jgi:uncharacterized membrane protein YtjA (UPF0391 family)